MWLSHSSGNTRAKLGRNIRAMGRTSYLTAIGLTLIGLILSQLTVGRQQPQQSKPAMVPPIQVVHAEPPSAAWPTAVSMSDASSPSFLYTAESPTPNALLAAQEGQITPQMRQAIIDKLRQSYQREVLPKLKNVKLECRPNMPDTVREAIEPAVAWLRSVELYSLIRRITQEDLTSPEIETLILDRVASEGLIGREYQNRVRALTRSGIVATESELKRIERDRLRREGYNDQEIEGLLKEAEAVRAEFQKMYDELQRLIWDTLKKAYDKAYECCMKEAKDSYLQMMDSIARQLSLANQAEMVSMEKRNECLCAIASVSAGQSGAWSGEITHTESFVDERNETLGSGGTTRQNRYYKKHDYRAVVNLVYHFRSLVAGEGGSHIPAQVSANGSVDSTIFRENRWTSASMDKRQGQESKENYSGNVRGEESTVEVRIRPDGTYNVPYALPCANASGTDVTRSYTEGSGFPEFQKKNDTRSRLVKRDVCPTQPGVLLRDGQHIGITGKIDPKNLKTLSGSKTFEVPLDGNPKVNKTITINWSLKRCR
jgi:hypothetical protein